MSSDRLHIANRIHLLLRRSLGEGISVQRMLSEPRYARDVLLVCDAMQHADLLDLARQFRAAPARRPDTHAHADAPATGWGADSTGFGHLVPPGRPAMPGQTQPGWLESTFRWIGL